MRLCRDPKPKFFIHAFDQLWEELLDLHVTNHTSSIALLRSSALTTEEYETPYLCKILQTEVGILQEQPVAFAGRGCHQPPGNDILTLSQANAQNLLLLALCKLFYQLARVRSCIAQDLQAFLFNQSSRDLFMLFPHYVPGDRRQMTGRPGAASAYTCSSERGTPFTYFCPSAAEIRSLAATSALSSRNACKNLTKVGHCRITDHALLAIFQ